MLKEVLLTVGGRRAVVDHSSIRSLQFSAGGIGIEEQPCNLLLILWVARSLRLRDERPRMLVGVRI